MKYFIALLVLLVAGVVVWGGIVYVSTNTGQVDGIERPLDKEPIRISPMPESIQAVDVMDDFGNKWVYTTDTTLPEKPFVAHCSYAGGEFNSCGTICPSDAEICAQVCAYTCENL